MTEIESFDVKFYKCPICKKEFDGRYNGEKMATRCLSNCTPEGEFAQFTYEERTIHGRDAEDGPNDKPMPCMTVTKPGQEVYAWIPTEKMGRTIGPKVNEIRRRDDGVIEFGMGSIKNGPVIEWVTGDKMIFGGK